MAEIITLGETMISFTPASQGPLRYIRNFESRIAGAESNLAVGVSKLGHSASWVSALGEDEFGHFIENSIRGEGVDTSYVHFDQEHHTGLMFKQIRTAAETSVFYYREDSAASHMPHDIVPASAVQTARIFHTTGITPILGKSCREAVYSCVSAAKKHGTLFSFDPNIRKKLWKNRDYTQLIIELILQADIVLMGLSEAEMLFSTTDLPRLADYLFTNGSAKYIAIKDGKNGAFAADHNQLIPISPHPCCCIDPIGAGDAFNSAFLCGLLEGRQLSECGRMGAAAGALATETYGDTEGYPTLAMMNSIMNNVSDILR